jgi:hypothetical protein
MLIIPCRLVASSLASQDSEQLDHFWGAKSATSLIIFSYTGAIPAQSCAAN